MGNVELNVRFFFNKKEYFLFTKYFQIKNVCIIFTDLGDYTCTMFKEFHRFATKHKLFRLYYASRLYVSKG